MKIKSTDADRFVRAPTVTCVLVYGPDQGLAGERAQALVDGVLGSETDPFRLAEPTAAAVIADPALLMDEAGALALTGGRRVVRVQRAGDGAAPAFESVLEARQKNGGPEDSLVIAEAGDLGPRSTLRKLFETAKVGAAVPCYAEDGPKLEAFIADTLRSAGHTVESGAAGWLANSLGSDRAITRGELEKLSLYVGPGAEVTLAEAQACVGDSGAHAFDTAAIAAITGNYADLDRALTRSEIDGAGPVSVLRALSGALIRVHFASGLRDAGASPREAVAALRPPVFFKQRDWILAALNRWSTENLARALSIVQEAEEACKTTGIPAYAVANRAALRIANAARRR